MKKIQKIPSPNEDSIQIPSEHRTKQQIKFNGKISRGRAISAPPFRRRRFSAGQLGAVSFRHRTFRCRFLIYFLFFELWRKNNEAGNFLNAVEREPVETRVLNPTASGASYKPKQRSYRKMNLKNSRPDLLDQIWFVNWYFSTNFITIYAWKFPRTMSTKRNLLFCRLISNNLCWK